MSLSSRCLLSTLLLMTSWWAGGLPAGAAPRRPSRVAATPRIARLTPGSFQVGVPNALPRPPRHIDLTLDGKGFRRGDQVGWDGQPLVTRFVSSTCLTARVPFAFLDVNRLRTVRPRHAGNGPRGMDAAGAVGTALIHVQRGARKSNRKAFTVDYVVVGG